MTAVEEELLAELIRLRRGFGLASVNLRGRLGPRLKGLCRIADEDGDRVIRTKVLAVIRRLDAALSDEDRMIVHTALGATREIQHRRLGDRVDIIAQRFVVAERTARRAVDRAFQRLAEEGATLLEQPAAETDDDPETGWYVQHVDTIVRMDRELPEIIESRQISSVRPGLKTIAIRYSLPPSDSDTSGEHALQVDISFGAKIVDVRLEGGTHYRYLLELPLALEPGQQHEYGIVLRPPSVGAMRTHYGLVPLVEIESFRLRVRFHPDRHPGAVWRFDRAAPRAIDGLPISDARLSVDDVGEVAQEFDRLERGYGYGIAWRP